MRFKIKNKPQTEKSGQTRTKFKFAWLPKQINDYYVWLELYKVVEIYKFDKDSKQLEWEVAHTYLKD